MVHGRKLILIRRYILRIIGDINNKTHDRIWHVAPMSKLKEELEHHIEICQMFSHHLLFIGAFIVWVRRPSILLTFILRSCHAFIISNIVVTGWSIIFIEHFLWHLITAGKISTHVHVHPACDVQIGMLPYMGHMIDSLEFWFIIACHGGREAGWNFWTCCDVLGVFFSILDKSVWGWASLTLAYTCTWYNTSRTLVM